VGFRAKLTAATALVDASVRGADTIRRDLDVALDVINGLRKATDEEAVALLEKYDAVLGSVRKTAAAASVDGRSLVDGSGYGMTLNEAGAAGWQRALEHGDLTPGPDGLDLPLVSELGTGEKNCDDAQRRIAGAVKAVNKASTRLSAHQKAIVKQLGQLDEDQQSDREAFQNDAREGVREIAQIVVIALVIALIFRSLIFQPFHIPSGSMKSTLLKGDYLFVSKYAYGYSNKSFPFGVKMFDGRIFNKVPERGDVIVFKMTRDGETDYIKRLIGLPGDKIQMRNGVLSINDKIVPKVFDSEVLYTDGLTGDQFMVDQFTETLPNGVSHKTLDFTPHGRNDTTSIYRVPERHYFFMGDNRDNSQDSRVIGGGVGFVPEENLVGRAEVIFLSVDGTARIWQIWRWPTAIRYSRFFKRIR
jgi:signal peptidase I